MWPWPGDDPSLPGSVRFRLSVQRNRLAGYALAALIGVLFKAWGTLEVRWIDIGLLALASESSAALLVLWTRQAHRRGWPLPPHTVWMGIDIVLTSWAVARTGGIDSPVYPWYLTISAAAAFVVGRRGLAVYTVACTALYLVTLRMLGQIEFWDRAAAGAFGRMLFLYGGGTLFLYGITELRDRRNQIRALHEADERKVGELSRLARSLDQRSRELEEANRRATEASRLKSQFLANMSHELRTPLNSIIGFSEILQTRLDGQLSEKHQRFLGNIHESGHRLLSIINDILDLSKIEAGSETLAPEPIPLGAAVEGVAMLLAGAANKRRITIRREIPQELPLLVADPAKIKQILHNLLSNALKFSPEGSEVTVTARVLAAADSPLGEESIELRVCDRGIGIDPRDRTLIFEEFRQADGSAGRRYEGAGLGLALVRKYCDIHGGRIRVEGAPGEGSTFVVDLPRRRAAPGAATSPAAHAAPGAAASAGVGTGLAPLVLVVEDDPVACALLEQDLAQCGFRTAHARHGDEALRLVRELAPAAITLDLVLPGKDGWEVLRQLKNDPRSAAIPVVIISRLENQELGLALGANDYLLKPVERDLLIPRINRLVSARAGANAPLLVIDDDPALHALLRESLDPLGRPLLHAYGGADGLRMAREREPALIILDLMMPEVNGFEVAALLREDAKTRAIPVVVLTAKELTEDDRRALAGKIASVQRKSGNHAELLTAVRGLLAPPREEGAHA